MEVRSEQSTMFDFPLDQDEETGQASSTERTMNNQDKKDLQRRITDFRSARLFLNDYCCSHNPDLLDFRLATRLSKLRADMQWTREAERRRKEGLPFFLAVV
jgi:hypothetical protein